MEFQFLIFEQCFFLFGWASKESDVLLFRDNNKNVVCMCDRDSNQKLGSLLTKFCSLILGRKISVKFVNGEKLLLKRF